MSEHIGSMRSPSPSLLRAPSGVSTARIELSAADFGLEPLFETIPDAEVHIEPTIANPTDHALLVVRTSAGDRDQVETALWTDRSVAIVEAFEGFDDRYRFRITWEGQTYCLIDRIVTDGATIATAHGRAGQWELRLTAPEHGTVTQVHDTLEEEGYRPEVLSLQTSDDYQPNDFGTSDPQRATLVTAFEMDDYDVPRTATLTDVALELGVSHQALSERVRRAHAQLVETNHISPDSQVVNPDDEESHDEM